MFNSNSSPFTMPVVPANSNSGFGGFGNDGWGWIWIILIFAIFGWGNGGWGGYGNGGGGTTSVYEGYVLNNDFSVLSNQMSQGFASQERKLDGITNGLCSLGYDNLAQINGVNMNIANSAANITNAITADGYENRLGQQGISQQISNCCCDLRQQIGDVNYNLATQANMISRGVENGFAQTNYNMATNTNQLDRTVSDKFCQTNFNMQTNTRDIVDSQNAGTRAILDKLCQMEANAKDEKIAELTAKNFDLRLAASQEAQNNYLVSQLGYQCPKPAYVVQPPQTVAFATGCNGVATFGNTGCGCGVSVQ